MSDSQSPTDSTQRFETKPLVTLHAPFLERSANPAIGSDSELALGAFLTLRALDHLAEPTFDKVAFFQQWNATIEYLEDLTPQTMEIRFLRDILQAIPKGMEPKKKLVAELWTGIAAFSAWLEAQLRLDEASDVLDTALRVADGRGDPTAAMSIHLNRGRVLRTTGRFLDATAAYKRAQRLAITLSDTHTELLSRIGQANVAVQLGNLPTARNVLTEVADDAERLEDWDAQARALHDLSVVAIGQKRPAEAAHLAHQAYVLYVNPPQKHRAMHDLGVALARLGHLEAARHAFELVQCAQPQLALRVRTLLEMLAVSSEMGDRVTFELTRRRIDSVGRPNLPPTTLADYELNLGKAWIRFGAPAKARKHLEETRRIAEEFGLNEYYFLAESSLDEIESAAEFANARARSSVPDWNARFPEFQRLADELRTLANHAVYVD